MNKLINSELKAMITTLSESMSISGFENRSHAALKALASDWFDEVKTDRAGNMLFIKRCGAENAPRIMIDTHFDEIGMIVKAINDGGFVKVAKIGGLDTRIMPAGEAVIYGKQEVYGVFGATPPHLQRPGDNKKLPELKDIIIDTGYEKSELEKLVSIGDPVGFKCVNVELLNGFYAGKGLDDKVCCAAALYAVKLLGNASLSCDVFVSCSVQEEVSDLGGGCGAFGIDPDIALVIDVDFATAPEIPKAKSIKCGEGPGIVFSAATDRALTEAIIRLAENRELKLQKNASPNRTGTNAEAIALAGRGIPTAALSIPLKNMHTYSEVVKYDDVEACAGLIAEILKSSKEVM